MEYTLAFIFSADKDKVLLIHKNRPQYQAGKLNGIGGKLEAGETPLVGVRREVEEETALTMSKDDWQFAGNLVGNDWKVWIYTTIYPHDMADARSVTDEAVVWYSVAHLPANCMENLFWLIPFCLRKLENPDLDKIICTYQ